MVYYEDFGAIGDGKTNDFFAIKRAHEYANSKGECVFAKPGATYYIGRTGGESAIIKTDVSWCGAKFIIDDRDITPRVNDDGSAKADIFTLESDYGVFVLTPENSEKLKKINGNPQALLRENLKKIDLGLGYPAHLTLFNEDNRQYIRYGLSGTSPQHEIISVDEDGNVSEKTPLLFDYEKITSIEVRRTSDTAIKVSGGEFVTLATKVHNPTGRFTTIMRGILMKRSNTVLENITHRVEGEIPKGEIIDGEPFAADSYYGFYRVYNCENVEIRNCVAQSRVTYSASYDIIAENANDVRFINVKESEETFADVKCWGIMGSNFCKNITYDSCYLSRFDAHQGVYNAKIINSTLSCLRLTGGGEFYMENSTLKAKAYASNIFIMLREDYGSTWRGNITLKNCTFDSVFEDKRCDTVHLIWGQWVNHDFGYETHTPSLYVENFKVEKRLGTKEVKVFTIVNADKNLAEVSDFKPRDFDGVKNENPYVPPKSIVIKNCPDAPDFTLAGDFFKDMEFVYEK